MTIEANIVDVLNGTCFYGTCTVRDGKIESMEKLGEEKTGEVYLMPGFIDAHVHIESSMLVPTEFARLAVKHGTVATVSDPHEIANVLGKRGVEYMLENAAQTPFKFYFGVPSCVPATTFETAGATIDSDDVRELLSRDDLHYLAEMMNYPGVLHNDPEVMQKIHIAKELGKPIDGHSPGLTGDDAIRYINAGISTDHECVSYAEARHKLDYGMKIIIREGSAAKNFEALHALISQHPDRIMLCSDDKHPDDLNVGHINQLVSRAVANGHRWQDVLRVACVNPVEHYSMQVGLLREGDPADMIVVSSLSEFNVQETYTDGICVFRNDNVDMLTVPIPIENQFHSDPVSPDQLSIEYSGGTAIRVIRAIDGSLLTEEMLLPPVVSEGRIVTDLSTDLLKIVVHNRYSLARPAIAFIHGFGLSKGAIASSVAHDSHNIVAVGVDDESLAEAINVVIAQKGGIAAVDGKGRKERLALPVAGIMSDRDGEYVAAAYTRIDRFAKDVLGATLLAPFMTCSFMALLVIPRLKLSDLGLFDGKSFRFADMEIGK